jgi:hypothetical protein
MAEELPQKSFLVIAETFEVELGGKSLLVTKVMVDAADARARSGADLVGGRSHDPVFEKAGERRIEDVTAALRRGLRSGPAFHGRDEFFYKETLVNGRRRDMWSVLRQELGASKRPLE